MNLTQLSKWENLTQFHPAPWYLGFSNDSGVEVKDAQGYTVYFEDFGCIPDEMPTSEAIKIRAGAVAFALWLVAYSECPNSE